MTAIDTTLPAASPAPVRAPLSSYWRVKLRIRLKELAFEARENRRQAARLRQRGDRVGYQALTLHRKGAVRSAARCALLAHAFLAGRAYAEVERIAAEEPDWKRVRDAALRFGCPERAEPDIGGYDGVCGKGADARRADYDAWEASAKAHFQANRRA